jgi:tetrahydromethanopterin S-methyltransferase subunit C
MDSSSLRRLFLAVEVNLVFWIVAVVVTKATPVVVVGFLVAAVLQHWAYYDLYKRLPSKVGHSDPAT